MAAPFAVFGVKVSPSSLLSRALAKSAMKLRTGSPNSIALLPANAPDLVHAFVKNGVSVQDAQAESSKLFPFVTAMVIFQARRRFACPSGKIEAILVRDDNGIITGSKKIIAYKANRSKKCAVVQM